MKITILFLAALPALAQSVPNSTPAAGSAPASVAAPPAKPVTSAAASSPAPNSPLEYSEIVMVPGATKDQLYSAAVLWFSETFRSSKNVLDVQDKDGGNIVGKALTDYQPVRVAKLLGSGSASNRIAGTIRYTVTIQVKDGRYRYSITSFIHEGTADNGFEDLDPESRALLNRPLSFGLLTMDEICPSDRTGMNIEFANPIWADLKHAAKDVASGLAKNLKDRMAQPSKGADNW